MGQDVEFYRAHDAGCEMLGRGGGVPETLCKIADHIEAAFGEVVPDKIIAACGRLLLAWRTLGEG